MGCSASRVEPRPALAVAKEARALEKPLVKTVEQLTTEAELAKLRRLTPEQEAAAAEAAKHIKKVAAAAEAAPEAVCRAAPPVCSVCVAPKLGWSAPRSWGGRATVRCFYFPQPGASAVLPRGSMTLSIYLSTSIYLAPCWHRLLRRHLAAGTLLYA